MSWLDAYAPDGAAEQADVARIAAALAAGDVWSRSTPLHVTGSAIVVHPPTRRVLLRWHERYGIWNHVGGHADDDEQDPWVTALREAMEETGLRDLRPFPGPEPAIAFVEIVPVPAARGEPDHEHADVSYVLATDEPDAIADEHDDAELRWLPFDEARAMVNFHVGALLDRVRRLERFTMRGMPVRRLTSGDEAAAEAACRTFGSEGELDVSRFLGRDDVHLFVVEDGDGVAGWVYGQELLHPDGEVTMLLYALDVAERAHRRGHGRALVTAFVDHARDRGCSEVWVLTEPGNEAALATYAAAGGIREVEDSAMVVWPLIPGHQPP